MNLSRSISSNITTTIVCFLAVLSGAATARPPDSLLVDNGAYYRYQGKPVNLLEFTDRISIVYKDDMRATSASNRRLPLFRGKLPREIRAGKQQMGIVTFDRPLADHVRTNGFSATIDSLRGIAATDRTISFVNPVYYNADAGDEIVVTDRVLVRFSDTTDIALRARVAGVLDAVPGEAILPGVYRFKLNNSGTIDAFGRIRRIESISGIDWVEPEILAPMKKYFLPDDPYFGKQWHLNNTGQAGGSVGADCKAAAAWDIWRGDASVTVAILDDGVDLQHTDLRIATGGKDYCGTGDNDPSPDSASDSHGTAVAGVAAAIGNNAIGVAGVCPGAKILPIKICIDNDFVDHSEIALAMSYAAQNGAAILNNSWGGSTPSNILRDAIRTVSKDGRGNKGCLVFCASGNGGTTFETQAFSISANATLDIAFVYQKNSSGFAGNDLAAIDNVIVLSADQSTVIAMENFSGTTLPAGWSTGGGVNGLNPPVRDPAVSGWSRTTTLYDGGYGGRSAYRSGAIGDDRWTELRMPRRTFSAGQVVRFSATISSEENGDSLRVRAYNTDGSIAFDVPFVSGIDSASVPTIAFPAGADSSIAVGASNDRDYRSAYSQYDVAGGTAKTVDFLAPSGGGISGVYSTDRRGAVGYTTGDYTPGFSGTSSACPAAAGVAALILSRNPQLSRNKVLEVMRLTCDPIGDVAYVGGKNNEYGYGRLNAQRALTNLPPVITGQNAVGGVRGRMVVLGTGDLVIYDVETPAGPFTLSAYGGSNYTVSGATITPAANFSGTLSVPVTVRDGTYESDRFLLTVNIRDANAAPVISAQVAMSMLEDGKRLLAATDFTITDADDPGPFTLVITPGVNYTVVNDTVFPAPDFFGTLPVSVAASDGFATGPVFQTTITVTSVNDAPSFTQGADLVVDEDRGAYSAGWATAISRGPSNESGQTIGFIVTTTNGALFQAAPSLSNAGVLSFTPKANMNSSAQVSVRLNDDGGTANGGVASSAQITFTITVQAVNDPPVFTPGTNDTVIEGAGMKTVASWARDIGTGASNESQDLDFVVTTDNNAFFAVLPAITNTGTLTYTPAANASGSVLVTVRLHDNGGGTDLSAPATFTIFVDPVNDAPSFTAGPNVSCNEDAGLQTSGWATAISAGPGEAGQTLTFVLATTSTPASLFSVLPAIGPDGVLTYTPLPDISGSASVNVRLRDNGGIARSGVDTSALRTFTITVNAVNDPPVFTPGPAVSVAEDAGVQTLTAWASMRAGPSDENSQTITRTLAVTNTSLFSVLPGIAANGTLTFTPAANSYGESQVTVTLTDNGGTALGGIPTLVATPFTITILPVNDAPSFTGGPAIRISEDAPPYLFSAWATQMNAGPGEGSQSVSFSVGCSNRALFSSVPAIDAPGTLSFTPAPNANGSATITVRLHDNGGTDRGGFDSSVAAIVDIDIASVNDVPRLTVAGNPEIPFASTGIITITADDPDGTVPDIRTSPLPAFISFSSVAGSGTAVLTCASTADTGTYPITVTAFDGSGSVDSIVRIHVNPTPTGAIEIVGAPADAVVSLYATSGWTGKPVRTGPGTIGRLTVGTYLLTVARPGSRIEYFIAEARPNGSTIVNVALRPPVPSMFSAPATFASANGPLDAGTLVSVVSDDIDNDGKRDVVFIGADGVVRVARNNGTVFEVPVAVISLFGGRNTLRCIDWNADGINDVLSVNIGGSVRISFGKGGLAFRPDSLLFNVTPGCSGVELVPGGAEHPARCYFSFSNGTVACVQIAGTTRTTLPVRLSDGTPLDVGDEANLTVLDVNGDQRFELLIGNAYGNVEAYTLVAADTVKSIGKVVAGGSLFSGTGGIMLSTTYGDAAGDLPTLVYCDGNGALFQAKGILRGDINADGTVDILDLQQLGIHWGQRGTDAGWTGAANLNAGNAITDPQVINVLDLQVLGNCWGLKK